MLFERPLYIIAEVANAAQGNVDDYYRIIDEVSRTGADGIKFQFYKFIIIRFHTYINLESFITLISFPYFTV